MYNLKNYSCYLCIRFGIGQRIVMVSQIKSDMLGDRIQSMGGQFGKESPR